MALTAKTEIGNMEMHIVILRIIARNFFVTVMADCPPVTAYGLIR